MNEENIIKYNGIKNSLFGVNAIGKTLCNTIINEIYDLSIPKRGRKPNESKGFIACNVAELQEIDDRCLQTKIDLAKQQNGYK